MKKTAILILVLIFATQVFAQTKHAFPPAPTYSSLMSSFMIEKDGILKIAGGWGYFFTHKKGVIKVSRNGNYVDEYEVSYPPSTPPFYSYDILQLKGWQQNRLGLQLKEAGNYELEFYMGGKKFYSFPFELKITRGDDQYNPNKIYRIEGGWSDYAFLYRHKKYNNWEFHAWYRSPKEDFTKYQHSLEVIRDSDKKIIALSSGVLHTERYWKVKDFVLRKKAKRVNGEIYETDIDLDIDKFKDGGYTIKTKLDGKLHRTFRFTVKDGEIQYQDRQIRDTTDPLRFIEGGKNQFWMKKVD